jgi:hypothetical protein
VRRGGQAGNELVTRVRPSDSPVVDNGEHKILASLFHQQQGARIINQPAIGEKAHPVTDDTHTVRRDEASQDISAEFAIDFDARIPLIR